MDHDFHYLLLIVYFISSKSDRIPYKNSHIGGTVRRIDTIPTKLAEFQQIEQELVWNSVCKFELIFLYSKMFFFFLPTVIQIDQDHFHSEIGVNKMCK